MTSSTIAYIIRPTTISKGLAAYKSFDDYRLFQDGYVESPLIKTLTSEGAHLYLGKVRPAMSEKTDEWKQ